MTTQLTNLVNWKEYASCKGFNTSWFYPEQNDRTNLYKVRMICESCPVKQNCLDHAIETQETQGIWGGMGHRSRLVYAKKRRQG